MPTTAAAALSNTAREIGLIPRMSVTECMTSVSPSPTNGPNGRRPEALGRDDQLGHAHRQAGDGGRAQQGTLGTPEAQHAVEPALLPQPVDHRPHPALHLLDGCAARTGRTHGVELRPGGAGHLGARHIGLAAGGLAEDARVDHHGRRPSARTRSRT